MTHGFWGLFSPRLGVMRKLRNTHKHVEKFAGAMQQSLIKVFSQTLIKLKKLDKSKEGRSKQEEISM